MLVVTPTTCIDVTTWLSAPVSGSVSRATRRGVPAYVDAARTVAAAAVQHERGGIPDASPIDGILQRMSLGVPA